MRLALNTPRKAELRQREILFIEFIFRKLRQANQADSGAPKMKQAAIGRNAKKSLEFM